MPAIPETFHAFVVGHDDHAYQRGVRQVRASDLPEGDTTVRVTWSGINYKDALATAPEGRVARIDPLIPGIDLAGEVIEPGRSGLEVGAGVLAHGYELGVSRHGGYAEYARVPAGWLVPLPDGLSARDAMAIGTAGFTAALAVERLEHHGITPDAGPVLVTGATGGVGRVAIDILSARGHEAWASTGKADAAEGLKAIGAAGIVPREELTAAGKALDRQRWAGAIDVAGQATLPYLLRTVRYGGIVAACGNTSGGGLETTVFPFILRAVTLAGIDSVEVPIEERRRIWSRLASDLRPQRLDGSLWELDLGSLQSGLEEVREGRARGRFLVAIGR